MQSEIQNKTGRREQAKASVGPERLALAFETQRMQTAREKPASVNGGLIVCEIEHELDKGEKPASPAKACGQRGAEIRPDWDR